MYTDNIDINPQYQYAVDNTQAVLNNPQFSYPVAINQEFNDQKQQGKKVNQQQSDQIHPQQKLQQIYNQNQMVVLQKPQILSQSFVPNQSQLFCSICHQQMEFNTTKNVTWKTYAAAIPLLACWHYCCCLIPFACGIGYEERHFCKYCGNEFFFD